MFENLNDVRQNQSVALPEISDRGWGSAEKFLKFIMKIYNC